MTVFFWLAFPLLLRTMGIAQVVALSLAAVVGEIAFLRALIGVEEISVARDMFALRRKLFGCGLWARYRLATIRNLQFIDTEHLENGFRSFYFEADHIPHWFGRGVQRESAARLLASFQQAIPERLFAR
jgi:hypothetical protein